MQTLHETEPLERSRSGGAALRLHVFEVMPQQLQIGGAHLVRPAIASSAVRSAWST